LNEILLSDFFVLFPFDVRLPAFTIGALIGNEHCAMLSLPRELEDRQELPKAKTTINLLTVDWTDVWLVGLLARLLHAFVCS